MKAWLVNTILIAIGGVILTLIGLKWNNINEIPVLKEKIKQDSIRNEKALDEFIRDQAENNKTYNGMLYSLNKWKREQQIIDSLNSKH